MGFGREKYTEEEWAERQSKREEFLKAAYLAFLDRCQTRTQKKKALGNYDRLFDLESLEKVYKDKANDPSWQRFYYSQLSDILEFFIGEWSFETDEHGVTNNKKYLGNG